jgi:hypothetical protein
VIVDVNGHLVRCLLQTAFAEAVVILMSSEEAPTALINTFSLPNNVLKLKQASVSCSSLIRSYMAQVNALFWTLHKQCQP